VHEALEAGDMAGDTPARDSPAFLGQGVLACLLDTAGHPTQEPYPPPRPR
jgi:hypothetical protein